MDKFRCSKCGYTTNDEELIEDCAMCNNSFCLIHINCVVHKDFKESLCDDCYGDNYPHLKKLDELYEAEE
jgi:hypothetical protein